MQNPLEVEILSVYNSVSEMGAKSQKMNCMLEDGTIFMKIIDGIKDLCPDGNLDFTEHGMQMQIMDASHVSLCSLI